MPEGHGEYRTLLMTEAVDNDAGSSQRNHPTRILVVLPSGSIGLDVDVDLIGHLKDLDYLLERSLVRRDEIIGLLYAPGDFIDTVGEEPKVSDVSWLLTRVSIDS